MLNDIDYISSEHKKIQVIKNLAHSDIGNQIVDLRNDRQSQSHKKNHKKNVFS